MQLYFLSGWRDSNPRPLAPHASTLAICATPRKMWLMSMEAAQRPQLTP